uniref:EGF-like domain-containing protein n=1 Tax=Branchiostoma floridae TaxID=7739 RepID=C3YJU1_BRAFL|eukprot:XP_002603387.1 hypothetical protein BRAFLDRAFT_80380 [Branchiostoma floridae]
MASDWSDSSINFIHDTRNLIYMSGGGKVLAVEFYDESRQLLSQSDCQENNGGCQHTCVGDVSGHRCLCLPDYSLAEDQHACVKNDHLFTKALLVSTDEGILQFPHNLVDLPGTADSKPAVVLYWTETGRIFRSTLAGTNKAVIVSSQSDVSIGNPTGIAVDLPNSWVYWTDREKVMSSNLRGEDVEPYWTSNGGELFGIAVYKDFQFWTDRTNRTVSIGLRSTLEKTVQLQTTPHSVRVFDGSEQPLSRGPCDLRNGGCNELCLPITADDRVCACAEEHLMQADNLTCFNPAPTTPLTACTTDTLPSVTNGEFGECVVITGVKTCPVVCRPTYGPTVSNIKCLPNGNWNTSTGFTCTKLTTPQAISVPVSFSIPTAPCTSDTSALASARSSLISNFQNNGICRTASQNNVELCNPNQMTVSCSVVSGRKKRAPKTEGQTEENLNLKKRNIISYLSHEKTLKKQAKKKMTIFKDVDRKKRNTILHIRKKQVNNDDVLLQVVKRAVANGEIMINRVKRNGNGLDVDIEVKATPDTSDGNVEDSISKAQAKVQDVVDEIRTEVTSGNVAVEMDGRTYTADPRSFTAMAVMYDCPVGTIQIDGGCGEAPSSGGSNGTAVAVGVVVALLLLGAISLGGYMYCRQQRRKFNPGQNVRLSDLTARDNPVYDASDIPPAYTEYQGESFNAYAMAGLPEKAGPDGAMQAGALPEKAPTPQWVTFDDGSNTFKEPAGQNVYETIPPSAPPVEYNMIASEIAKMNGLPRIHGLPSTGLITVLMSTIFCDHTHMYGFFPFTTDAKNNSIPYHYYPGDYVYPPLLHTTGSHNMNREYDFFRDLHSRGNRLYFCDGGEHSIFSTDLLGNDKRRLLYLPSDYLFGIAIDDNNIYWSSWTTRHIGMLSRSNMQQQNVLVDSLLSPNDIYVSMATPTDVTNACSTSNGGCQELCLANPEGKTCACRWFWKLQQDGTCLPPGLETPSYLWLDHDPDNSVTSVKMTAGNSSVIRGLRGQGRPFPSVTLFKSAAPSRIEAIDYDFQRNLIFWADTGLRELHTVQLLQDGRIQSFSTLLEGISSGVEGLAVDWLNQNLYYTDSYLNWIAVVNYKDNPPRHHVIVHTGVDRPRGIAVHPQTGFLFWSDWSRQKPRIERAVLSGEQRTELVNTDIGQPSGLVIGGNRLYWADTFRDTIESCDLDGSNRELFYTLRGTHFYDITFDGEEIMASDWSDDSINFIDGERTLYFKGEGYVYGVEFFDQSRQQPGQNEHPFSKALFVGSDSGILQLPHNFLELPEAGDWTNSYIVRGTEAFAMDFNYAGKMVFYTQQQNGGTQNIERRSIIGEGDSMTVFENGQGIEDGSNRILLVSSQAEDIVGKPTALAIDYLQDRLYWVTSDPGNVQSSNLYGGDVTTLWSSSTANPLGVAIYKDFVLWTDNSTKSLRFGRPSIFFGIVDEKTTNLSTAAYNIKVYDDTEQPVYTSACDERNGLCTELCIPKGDGRVCACAEGRYIQADRVSCSDVPSILPTTPSPTVPTDGYSPGDFILVADSDTGFITEVNITSGSNVTLPLQSTYPIALDYDAQTDYVYWSDYYDEKIYRAKRDGSDFEAIVDKSVIERRLYWSDSGANNIQSSDLYGFNRRTLVIRSNTRFFGLSLHVHDLFWTSRSDFIGINAKSQESQGSNRVLADGFSNLRGIAMYGAGLRTDVTNACTESDSACMDMCLARPGGRTCVCRAYFVLQSDNTTCAPPEIKAPSYLWINLLEGGTTVVRMFEGNSSSIRALAQQTVTVTNLLAAKSPSIVVSLDYDIRQGLVFWIDVGLKEIQQVNVRTGKVTALKTEISTGAEVLATDWVNQNLYYTDFNYNRVVMVSYSSDSSNGNSHIISETGLDKPRGITVDPTAGFIFWTDWGQSPKIERATLSGENRTVIVDSDLGHPSGLVIDYVKKKLYFADTELDTISSCDFDGGNREEFYSLSGTHFYDITFDGEEIMATDWSDSTINFIHDSRNILAYGAGSVNRVLGVEFYHESRQPSGQLLYWTEVGGSTPRISRSTLAGTEQEVIISSNLGIAISKPTALSIDFLNSRVYWSDSDTGTVMSSNLRGKEPQQHWSSNGGELFGIAVYKDFNFWTDRTNRTVSIGLRSTLEKTVQLQTTPHSVRVFDGSEQPLSRGPCDLQNGGCNELCLPTTTDRKVCACAEGHQLKPDRLTCFNPANVPKTTSCTKDTLPPVTNGEFGRCPVTANVMKCYVVCRPNYRPTARTITCLPDGNWNITTEYACARSVPKEGGNNTAAVAVGVILALLLLGAISLGGYMYYRRQQRKLPGQNVRLKDLETQENPVYGMGESLPYNTGLRLEEGADGGFLDLTKAQPENVVEIEALPEKLALPSPDREGGFDDGKLSEEAAAQDEQVAPAPSAPITVNGVANLSVDGLKKIANWETFHDGKPASEGTPPPEYEATVPGEPSAQQLGTDSADVSPNDWETFEDDKLAREAAAAQQELETETPDDYAEPGGISNPMYASKGQGNA